MPAIEQTIDHPLRDAISAGLNLRAVTPPRARRWRNGEITRPKLDSLRSSVPERGRAVTDANPPERSMVSTRPATDMSWLWPMTSWMLWTPAFLPPP